MTRNSNARIADVANVSNAGYGIFISEGSSVSLTDAIGTSLSGAAGVGIFDGSRLVAGIIAGAANTTYGVEANRQVTVKVGATTTVTGGTADVLLGAAGNRTWVQVAGGLTADTSDYGVASPLYASVIVV